MIEIRKKMLILSAHPPIKHAKEAGQKIFFEFVKEMSRHFEIYLLSFIREEERQWGVEEAAALCMEAHFFETGKSTKIMNSLLRPFYPIVCNTKMDKRFVAKAKELARLEFAAIHYEWEQMGQYTRYFQKSTGIQTVMCHDVLSQMYERLSRKGGLASRTFNRLQLSLSRRFERHLFHRVHYILTLNHKDANLVKDMVGSEENVKVCPPYYHRHEGLSSVRKKYDLVFFGAMNRFENEDAIQWFLQEMYQVLCEEKPDLSLLIVGNSPSQELMEEVRKHPNADVTGYVEDPYTLIAESKIGIVPLRFGAGIKIKTLEFLSCGIPVVSTSIGAEGIDLSDSEGLFVKDDPKAFVACIRSLMENEAYRNRSGDMAREEVGKKYDYTKNGMIYQGLFGYTVSKGFGGN